MLVTEIKKKLPGSKISMWIAFLWNMTWKDVICQSIIPAMQELLTFVHVNTILYHD